MHLINLPLVLVLFLLIISTLVTGNCDVYDQNKVKVQRCRKIQECVDKSLLSNSNNLYVLEKVFRSTQPRPGVALIINYTIISYHIQRNKFATI